MQGSTGSSTPNVPGVRIGTIVLLRSIIVCAARVASGDNGAWRNRAAVFCVLILGGLLWSAPALALSQRGHVFGFYFGSPGEGDGHFKEPAGIAVNESTGDVYVVDRGNNRIEQLGPKGEFIATWGFGVSDGEQKFEVCTTACRAGTGIGALDSPGAIAVDNSTGPSKGDVYVVMDARAGRGVLWKLSANGEKLKPGTLTQNGIKGEKWEGALDGVAVDSSGSVWVYRAATAEQGIVERFTGEAENRFTTTHELEATPKTGSTVLTEVTSYEGIAVGTELVGTGIPAGATVAKVSAEEQGKKELTMSAAATAEPGKEKITAIDGGITLEPSLLSSILESEREAESVFCAKPGFAVDASSENFYVDHERLNGEGVCPEVKKQEEEAENKKIPPVEKPQPVVTAKLEFESSEEVLEGLIGGLDADNTAAVAVDLASGASTPLGEAAKGDVYVVNGNVVAAFDPSGTLIQRFGAEQLTSGSGVAIDSKMGTLYVADSVTGKVDVFEAESSGKPSVDGVSAQNLTPTSASLAAKINPNGVDTHYYFQYGTVNCVTSPASCTDVPSGPPGPDIGAGIVEQEVNVKLENLQPSTTYFYRVVASHDGLEVAGADTFGSITTLPTSVDVLTDNRAWEMVSPPEKFGSDIEAVTLNGAAIQASEDGNAMTYVSTGPVVAEPEGNRALDPTQVLSIRGANEWESQDLVTPHEKGEGLEAEGGEYRLFSPDLSLGMLQTLPLTGTEPLQRPPLSPPAKPKEKQEKTPYVRDNPPLQPNPSEQTTYNEAKANGAIEHPPGYVPLVTALGDTAETEFGGTLEFLDATPDLSHAVLSSKVPLTVSAGSAESYLYEWESGHPESQRLQPVGVRPDGRLAREPRLGQGFEGVTSGNTRHAISDDGTRVFWTNTPTEEEPFLSRGGEEAERVVGNHLYLRDMKHAETIQIDTAIAPIPPPLAGASNVGYQTATSDGRKVFFTDTARLTPESNQVPIPELAGDPADLYECEVIEVKGKLACDLKDLTPNDSMGERSADVLNVIPGASEDGSYIYFVANGVLAPHAVQGTCDNTTQTEVPDAKCNLYVSHDGTVSLIAILSGEDAPDWGGRNAQGAVGVAPEPRPDLADVTTRVSPNGRYLAFMSSESLTGYDNTDVNEATGKHADQEVFLYDAETKLLVCASCNPSGARPRGVFDTGQSGEGFGLVADRREIWNERWLAGSIPGWTTEDHSTLTDYQSRYLSDSGRLFFNSADALVKHDTNHRLETINGKSEAVGVEDVYEYEPNGRGSCAEANGCVSLISSGTSEQESAFLDASASGNDAFFVTAQKLLPQDQDGNFDVYDARVCTEASPCLPPQVPQPQPCATSKSCNGTTSSTPALEAPPTSTFQGPGNTAKQETLPEKVTKRPLTRAQQLANALKSCRKIYKAKAKAKAKKRRACEAKARKKYGAKKASKKASKSSKNKSSKAKR